MSTDLQFIKIKKPHFEKRNCCLWGHKQFVEYDDWPKLDGCWCGLCTLKTDVFNWKDWWEHQAFCNTKSGDSMETIIRDMP